jgi:hypothetical protein
MLIENIVGGALDGWTLDPEVLTIRPDCESCGRTDIAWTAAVRLLDVVATTNGVVEARQAFEGFFSVGAEPESAAWVCPCGDYGVVVIGPLVVPGDAVRHHFHDVPAAGPNRAARRAARRR